MKKLLLAVILLAGLTDAALARTVEQQLLSSLQKQGYVVLEQGYTILGRLRVVAENGKIRREIVVNPGTGEILRDYAVMLPAGPSPSKPVASAPTAVASSPTPVDTTATSSDPVIDTTTSSGSETTGAVSGEDTTTSGDDGTVTDPPADDGVDTGEGQIEIDLPESLIQMAPGAP